MSIAEVTTPIIVSAASRLCVCVCARARVYHVAFIPFLFSHICFRLFDRFYDFCSDLTDSMNYGVFLLDYGICVLL